MMNYEPAKIRRFLQDRFNDEELNHLCFDYFPTVHNDFTVGMRKAQKVQMILEYCHKQGRWSALMAALERERPQAYTEQFAKTPKVELAPHTPVERNTRQIFISYANQDAEFAQRLAADLKKRGWPVWIAPDSIRPGEKWVEAINRGLEECGIFLLVLTPNAVNSRWVKSETNIAIQWEHQNKMRFIPLRMQTNDVPNTPALWQGYQQIPFDKSYRVGLKALLNELQLKKPGSQPQKDPPLVPKKAPVRSGPVHEVKTPKTKPPSKQIPTFLSSWAEIVPVWGWGVLVVAIIGLSIWGLMQLGGGNTTAKTPIPEETRSESTELVLLTQTRTVTPAPAPTETATLKPPTNTPSPTTMPTATYTPTPTLDPNVPPPNADLHNTWERPADKMVMVFVPGGTFMMGSDDSDTDAEDDEFLQHEVTLDSFWIDRTEVTNAQYLQCVADGVCNASLYADDSDFNGDNYPVVGVSWEDADNYCRWAGAALPTEAQWEYAARGTDGRIYPWGNDAPTCEIAQFTDCSGRTVPVGSFSPSGDSWVDATDMAGNVWEWMADWYGDYSGAAQTNPTGPATGERKVLRGGGWGDDQRYLRAAYRYGSTPDYRISYVGFRCAVSPGR